MNAFQFDNLLDCELNSSAPFVDYLISLLLIGWVEVGKKVLIWFMISISFKKQRIGNVEPGPNVSENMSVNCLAVEGQGCHSASIITYLFVYSLYNRHLSLVVIGFLVKNLSVSSRMDIQEKIRKIFSYYSFQAFSKRFAKRFMPTICGWLRLRFVEVEFCGKVTVQVHTSINTTLPF